MADDPRADNTPHDSQAQYDPNTFEAPRDRRRRRASELRQALFDKLWARFQQERGRDPVLQDLAQQRRRVLSLTRLGHLLTYQLGAALAIGVGEMRWKPTLAGGRDTPYRFTVRRSTIDAAMLQIVDDHGPSTEMTSAGVADTIVRMFIEQTAAHR